MSYLRVKWNIKVKFTISYTVNLISCYRYLLKKHSFYTIRLHWYLIDNTASEFIFFKKIHDSPFAFYSILFSTWLVTQPHAINMNLNLVEHNSQTWLSKLVMNYVYLLQWSLRLTSLHFAVCLPLILVVEAKDGTISVASAFAGHQEGNLNS